MLTIIGIICLMLIALVLGVNVIGYGLLLLLWLVEASLGLMAWLIDAVLTKLISLLERFSTR